MRRIAAFTMVCLICATTLAACRSSESNRAPTTIPTVTTMPDMGNMLPGAEDTINPTNGANDPATDGTVDSTNGANAATDPTGDLRRVMPRNKQRR